MTILSNCKAIPRLPRTITMSYKCVKPIKPPVTYKPLLLKPLMPVTA